MKRLSLLVLAALLVVLGVWAPAQAWDLKLQGNMYHNFDYYSQLGDQGFFGPWNVDQSAATAPFANANAWLGHHLQDNTLRDMFAGHDASRRYYNVELFPEIRINPAVRLRAKWRLVSAFQFGQNDYIADTSPGVDVAMASGFITMFRADVTLPWGIFTVGKRPDAFGMGLHYNELQTTSESVALTSNYGPFRIAWSFRPWRVGASESTFTSGPPNNIAGPNLRSQYLNDFERNDMRMIGDTQLAVTYRAGPLDTGFRYSCNTRHYGPESRYYESGAARLTAVQQGTFFDFVEWHGTAYAKYYNGRFFFNTELAHVQSATYRMGQLPAQFAGANSRYGRGNPSYINSWRWAVELGTVVGPSKISLFYAYLPGQDRRGWNNGNMRAIADQPFTNTPGFGMNSVFKPYSLLMGHCYGSGVNAYDLAGNGYFNEAKVLALRHDYAIAANLNFYASLLWAERSSHGHAWGFLRPYILGASGFTTSGFQVQYVNDRTGNVGTVDNPSMINVPNIPDTGLGWEVTMGADWKLLEDVVLNTRIAYFAPGRWWSYAAIDRSVVGWNAVRPDAGNNFGVNPQRTIDSVFGLECNVNVSF